VWIQDGSGKFVKTLIEWGTIEASYLTKWNATGHSDLQFRILRADLYGRRYGGHGAHVRSHTATWKMTDANGATVPDGEYTAIIEVTDKDASGQTTSFPITKGPGAADSTPANVTYYTGISVKYQ